MFPFIRNIWRSLFSPAPKMGLDSFVQAAKTSDEGVVSEADTEDDDGMCDLGRRFPGTPFRINVSQYPKNTNETFVEIFREGVFIGGYTRNYRSFGYETFYPFQVNDVWYCLYSTDHTATRVGRLSEEFEDWCGQDPDSMGFCPTEFFVPQYFIAFKQIVRGDVASTSEDVTWNTGLTQTDFVARCVRPKEDLYYGDVHISHHGHSQILNTDWGLVSGCIWGDDSSWKLRFIDLKGVPEKKLVITEKFGYWELPADADSIRNAIRIVGNGYVQLTGTFEMKLSGRPNDSFAEDFFEEGA